MLQALTATCLRQTLLTREGTGVSQVRAQMSQLDQNTAVTSRIGAERNRSDLDTGPNFDLSPSYLKFSSFTHFWSCKNLSLLCVKGGAIAHQEHHGCP